MSSTRAVSCDHQLLMEPSRLSIPPSFSDSRQHVMRLLKNLFNRLSDGLLVTVPSRIRAAREFASAPVLRLVSNKTVARLPATVSRSGRLPTRPVNLRRLKRRSGKARPGFLRDRMSQKAIGSRSLEADTTLHVRILMLRHFMSCVDP